MARDPVSVVLTRLEAMTILLAIMMIAKKVPEGVHRDTIETVIDKLWDALAERH